ncbi:LexA family protein [Microbulbifer variabilis]|uniref:Peptidase S24/S26A/S26B/S26C domain-containing protein n=1 Tax=Microbulbifer variabilis TaxID=266805 RepID=A0ABY4VD79_9GAMM|nr:S24 family peptidase [Microbulbifer variabilis]USD19929.1 hypothetical protein MJO52_12660 [Microbulbifer variabilis]
MKLTPLYGSGVSCGFPSPADDYKEEALSLDDHLITSGPTTFMARANGDSMQGVGIFDRDILIIPGESRRFSILAPYVLLC